MMVSQTSAEEDKMKFITSGQSFNMIVDPSITWDIDELTQEEFEFMSYDAVSYVGHEDVAKLLNVEYNKAPITVRPGDMLFVINRYKQHLSFYCVRVREAEHPLIKETVMEEA